MTAITLSLDNQFSLKRNEIANYRIYQIYEWSDGYYEYAIHRNKDDTYKVVRIGSDGTYEKADISFDAGGNLHIIKYINDKHKPNTKCRTFTKKIK